MLEEIVKEVSPTDYAEGITLFVYYNHHVGFSRLG
jgi:hypothetical protein